MISLLLRYRVLVISWVIVTYSRVSTRGLQRMQLASGPEVQSEGSFEREIRSEKTRIWHRSPHSNRQTSLIESQHLLKIKENYFILFRSHKQTVNWPALICR